MVYILFNRVFYGYYFDFYCVIDCIAFCDFFIVFQLLRRFRTIGGGLVTNRQVNMYYILTCNCCFKPTACDLFIPYLFSGNFWASSEKGWCVKTICLQVEKLTQDHQSWSNSIRFAFSHHRWLFTQCRPHGMNFFSHGYNFSFIATIKNI